MTFYILINLNHDYIPHLEALVYKFEEIARDLNRQQRPIYAKMRKSRLQLPILNTCKIDVLNTIH